VASTETQPLDGRQQRTARSRRALCEACLDLVQEGVLQPSADQVADRAGLSRRSIFNHFADLAELYDAVAGVGMQRYAPLLEEVSEREPLPQRVERLVRVRARFLEATSAFTRALTAQALVGPAADQAIRVSQRELRRQHREVERLFGGELDALSAGERAELLEAVSAALAPLQWEYLRRSRGCSVARARAVLERTLRALLADASAA
jgi:AcrR family transcriptional regulator